MWECAIHLVSWLTPKLQHRHLWYSNVCHAGVQIWQGVFIEDHEARHVHINSQVLIIHIIIHCSVLAHVISTDGSLSICVEAQTNVGVWGFKQVVGKPNGRCVTAVKSWQNLVGIEDEGSRVVLFEDIVDVDDEFVWKQTTYERNVLFCDSGLYIYLPQRLSIPFLVLLPTYSFTILIDDASFILNNMLHDFYHRMRPQIEHRKSNLPYVGWL